MIKSQTEELINRLDPDKIQCYICKKWLSIHESDFSVFNISKVYYCLNCWEYDKNESIKRTN